MHQKHQPLTGSFGMGTDLPADDGFSGPGARDDSNPLMPLVQLAVEVVDQLTW
jgi:hypothetical protein